MLNKYVNGTVAKEEVKFVSSVASLSLASQTT